MNGPSVSDRARAKGEVTPHLGARPPSITACLCYNPRMETSTWPDTLQQAQRSRVHALLSDFWHSLAPLADLLARAELQLALEQVHALRQIVAEMMLALNGIKRPPQTRHLNTYLGASQQNALARTWLLPEVTVAAIMAQAVALVVIYRWYAPQLIDALGGRYPHALETEVTGLLVAQLPDWPLQITTD